MHPIDWILIAATVLSPVIGFLAVSQHKRDFRHWTFFILTIFIGIWVGSNTIVYYEPEYETAKILNRITIASATLTVGALLYFALAIYGKTLRTIPRIAHAGILVSTITMAVLGMMDGPVVADIEKMYYGYNMIKGWAYWPFVIHLTLFFILSFTTFFLALEGKSRLERIRIIFIIVGTLTPAAISMVTEVIWYIVTGEVTFQKVGPASIIFFVLFSYYAIGRYRFLGIRLDVRRSISYALSLVITLSIGIFVAGLIKQADYPVPVIPHLVMAFVLAVFFFPLTKTLHIVARHIGRIRPAHSLDPQSIDLGDFMLRAEKMIASALKMRTRNILLHENARDAEFDVLKKFLKKYPVVLIKDETQERFSTLPEDDQLLLEEIRERDFQAILPIPADEKMMGIIVVEGDEPLDDEEKSYLRSATNLLQFQARSIVNDAKTTDLLEYH